MRVLPYVTSLIFLCGMIAIVMFTGKGNFNGFPGRRFKNNRMKLLDTLALGPQACLYMVQIDEEVYVVSMSNRSIQHIIKKDLVPFAQILDDKVK